jgi:hypothetical protein
MSSGTGAIMTVGDKLHEATAVKMKVDWQVGAATAGTKL